MNTIYICHLVYVSFTSFENRNAKQPSHIKWNLQIAPQFTEYRITDHISINTYRIVTNLFFSDDSADSASRTRYNPIGTHTWHLWLLSLPRVLPLIERVPFLHLFHLGTGRKARERKFRFFLFFFFHESETPEKKYVGTRFDCRSIFEGHRRLWRVR